MIDQEKKYQTREGRSVRIYATDGIGPYPVHGAYCNWDGWECETWTSNGFLEDMREGPYDLVEEKVGFKRTLWVNVYADTIEPHTSRQGADSYALSSRIACVEVQVEGQEGDGL